MRRFLSVFAVAIVLGAFPGMSRAEEPKEECPDCRTDPCEEPTVRMVHKVVLKAVNKGEKIYELRCVGGTSPVDSLIVQPGHWVAITNELEDGLTVQFKKDPDGTQGSWKLFGWDGKVEMDLNETVNLRVLKTADRKKSWIRVKGWAWDEPGPTIRVP